MNKKKSIKSIIQRKSHLFSSLVKRKKKTASLWTPKTYLRSYCVDFDLLEAKEKEYD